MLELAVTVAFVLAAEHVMMAVWAVWEGRQLVMSDREATGVAPVTRRALRYLDPATGEVGAPEPDLAEALDAGHPHHHHPRTRRPMVYRQRRQRDGYTPALWLCTACAGNVRGRNIDTYSIPETGRWYCHACRLPTL